MNTPHPFVSSEDETPFGVRQASRLRSMRTEFESIALRIKDMDKIAGFCKTVEVYDASWSQNPEHPSNPFVSSGDETPIDHGQASRLRSMRTEFESIV